MQAHRACVCLCTEGMPQVQVVASATGMIRCDAVDIPVLPRPAGEMAPPGAISAVVTACTGIPERQVAQTQVRGAALTELLAAVNSLQRSPGGIMNCALDVGFRLFIEFHYATRPDWGIMDIPPCASAAVLTSGPWPGLSDTGLRSAVQDATGWNLQTMEVPLQ